MYCVLFLLLFSIVNIIDTGRHRHQELKVIDYRVIDASLRQDAQLSQRDRAAGYISFGRKWKTKTERQYFTDIGLSSTIVT